MELDSGEDDYLAKPFGMMEDRGPPPVLNKLFFPA